MSSLLLKLNTAVALGLPNLWRVFLYRLGLKTGFNPVTRLKPYSLSSDIFFDCPKYFKNPKIPASQQWVEKHYYFGWYEKKDDGFPNWHKNPFTRKISKSASRDWWGIPDFDPEIGDIKTIWEASRFDWVIVFAQHAVNGNNEALKKLNRWLADWNKNNPAYKGANWKCGQEASIRVMHLAIATFLLDQHEMATESLKHLIEIHLRRIAPTISYAVAQNNNHGTSEAAALFIGGSWLYSLGDNQALTYQKAGLKWLENRAEKLIEIDGSFSQYSVNYHRVMLDTYSMAEYWRSLLNLPSFSPLLYKRLRAATNWLYQITQIENGDVPNLGANDGARLLPLTDTDYRDYRPSVQLASALFCNESAYSADGDWNLPSKWLGIKIPSKRKSKPKSSYFKDGGYSLLRVGNAFVLFNIPNFRFRPSQADALHVDFWLGGENLLCDAGTYSYNSDDDVLTYFGGTASHNTIQFDDRDQMPRLGRFLFGAWLKAKDVIPVTEKNERVMTSAGYKDYKGGHHYRTVKLSDRKLQVVDKVSGFKRKAVLRWRLQPDNWLVKGIEVSNGEHVITVKADANLVRFELVDGLESRYYLKKTRLPVLEVEVDEPCTITTDYSF